MAGPDLSLVTLAIDFGTVVTALAGVYASLVVVAVAWKGSKMLLEAVDGGRASSGGGASWFNSLSPEAQKLHYEREWRRFDEEERREAELDLFYEDLARYDRVLYEMERDAVSDADIDWIFSDDAAYYRDGNRVPPERLQ